MADSYAIRLLNEEAGMSLADVASSVGTVSSTPHPARFQETPTLMKSLKQSASVKLVIAWVAGFSSFVPLYFLLRKVAEAAGIDEICGDDCFDSEPSVFLMFGTVWLFFRLFPKSGG